MADECPHRRAPLSRGRLCRPKGGSGTAAPPERAGTTALASPDSGEVLLECAYHGWQFDGRGSCVRLPQLLPPGYNAAPAASPGGGKPATSTPGGLGTPPLSPSKPPRSCAGKLYRTTVAQGMVWVWYGNNPEEADESAIPLDFAEEGVRRGEDWALVDEFTRDFPYDWETMVENVVDPAHVAFAHDGTGQGLDRHAAPPLELQVTRSEPKGFIGRFRGVRPGAAPGSFTPGAWSELTFRAPCLVSMRFSLPGKGDAGLVLYCVPLGRGRSRMIARLPRNFATGWLARLQPRWAKHLPRMAVLDQDIDLLREQEAAMARGRLAAATASTAVPTMPTMAVVPGDEDFETAAVVGERVATAAVEWRSAYVMPAPADRFVIQFRRWLDRTGSSRPWALPDCSAGAAGASSSVAAAAAAAATAGAAAALGHTNGGDPLRREQVLDRYHSHVKSCSACSAALAAFQHLQGIASVVALAAVAAAAGLGAVAAAAAITCAGMGPALGAWPALAAGSWWAGPAGPAARAALAAGVVGALAAVVAAWAGRMAQRFQYTEEGRELRMSESRWLRRLLFSGTNSFNSMVALTNRRPR